MQMRHLESVIGFQHQRFSGLGGVSDPAHWVAILDVFPDLVLGLQFSDG